MHCRFRWFLNAREYRVSDARQQQVFALMGIRHDYNLPFPFWFFLGKIISKALFQNENLLEVINFVRVRDREFVGYICKGHVNQAQDGEKFSVVEVSFKRPQPGQPIEVFWKPAGALIIQKIEECECIPCIFRSQH